MENYYQGKFKSLAALLCGIFLSAAVFAQSNFTWIQKAGYPGPARHRSSAAAVGNRGYMGLGHVNSVFDILYDDWFEYDPGTDSWMQKANYPGGPRYHAACFALGNKVYVGTGRNINANLMTDFYSYDPVTNTWTTLAPFPGSGRRGAVAFALNGYGYIGTGSYTNDFYKYNPATNTWSPSASIPSSGRISSVAFAINGKGYVTTGDVGGPSTDLWEYNPVTNSWTAKANLPGVPRMEACGFALNGLGYVGTGDNYSSGTNYQDFWSYNPATNSWTQEMDFSGAARRYMVSFVIGTRAYTGLGTSGINYADLWEYGSINGVEENENGLLPMQVFPNPVHESTTLQFSNNVQHAELTLTGLDGKQVACITGINGTSYRFERNDISPGVYFFTLTESGKIISVSKIIFG